MKLTVFQSDKGDCLLLEAADGRGRMLVDGGMRRAYSAHVAPALGKLADMKHKIDVVYVSHIDQDHISGVLQMLDDEAAWRVHAHQMAHANPQHPEPDAPRPPEIGSIWHNSFHDQIIENQGLIEQTLAATAEILSGAEDSWLREVSKARRDLAASIPEALRVSRRIKPGQLNIPLNPEFEGKLMMVRDPQPTIPLGSINLQVIGPFPEDLTKLRREWNAWLRKNEDQVAKLRAQARTDEERLGTSELGRLIGPMLRAAATLGGMEIALAKALGNRKKVTAPNLASLMLLAEENGQTILLTGDGHWEDILRGLERRSRFDADGKLHLDVLKVQHHGSEHNIERKFCDRITADHYAFCGNGEHENPDLDVIKLIFDRRMENDSRPFRFWFNSSSKASVDEAGAAHMGKVERLVARLRKKSGGRLTARFLHGSSMRIL